MKLLELANNVWDLVQKSKDAALKEAFIELRLKIIELTEENIQLREQLLELRDQAKEAQRTLHFDGKLYWVDDSKTDGPYCQRCWDTDSKSIRLQRETRGWRCRSCSGYYQTEPDPPPRPRSSNWTRI